jgi:uncharacterized damage-inducible protein DinB
MNWKEPNMFEREITLSEFNRFYLRNLLAEFPMSSLDLDEVAFEGAHSLRWILAHLAIAADYGILQFGQPMVMPETWHQAYGPASQPGSHAEVLPTKSELVAAIDRGYHVLAELARNALVDVMNEPHSVGLLSHTPLKTKGDIVAHILATHFATHVGQLSVLRRMAGQKPLF